MVILFTGLSEDNAFVFLFVFNKHWKLLVDATNKIQINATLSLRKTNQCICIYIVEFLPNNFREKYFC